MLTTSDWDYALEERVAKALREECLHIFGPAWNYDHANRLARAAIEEMRRAGALSNGERDAEI